MLKQWSKIQTHTSGTHHLLNGIELYPHRFNKVLKFHPPGLAAVADASGAFHIDVSGKAAYEQRFKTTYGFYCDRAAVMDNNGNCFHVVSNGTPAYASRYAWCGNYQEDNCVVKNFDGTFHHINLKGIPLYKERYTYAGDYKDGIAVIKRSDGKSTHIDTYGIYIHNNWYEDLDVFHKGYARARDQDGWFHVDINGQPIYSERYLYIEPFYNEVAYAVTHTQDSVLVAESGDIIQSLHTHALVDKTLIDTLSGQITQYWNSFALIYFLQLDILSQLPSSLQKLTRVTKIPPENLKRLLSVIADLGYIRLDSENIVATQVGERIRQIKFFKDAANIWWQLSQIWGHGLDALQSVTQSFPDFKSSELSKIKAQSYHNGLLGYAACETPPPELLVNIISKKPSKILIVGRQGMPWASALHSYDASIHVHIYVPKWINEPIAEQQHPFPVQCLENINKWPEETFDAIFFIKCLLHYDDNAIKSILKEACVHLHPDGGMYIVEPVIGINGSLSALNLNMLFECGGKLRTQEAWASLGKALEFYTINFKRLSNNTLLCLSPNREMNQ